VRTAQKDGSLEKLSRKFFGRDYIPPAAAYDVDAIGQEIK
jgi:hypothetical protein